VLKLLPHSPIFEQKILFGKRIRTFFGDITWQSIAYSQNGCSELVLYRRINNPLCMAEAGIIFLPGPQCRNPRRFDSRMLRLFSWDETVCFDFAERYFLDLVDEQI